MTRLKTRAAIVLIVSTLTITGFAQVATVVVDAFDPSGTAGNSYVSGEITNVWMNWFGDAFRSVNWDAASDAGSNPGSGSMKITAMFDGTGGIPNQFEVFDGFSGINPPVSGSQYTNFECDVRFDPSWQILAGATPIFGHLEFGTHNGYNQDYIGSVDIPASNTNWVHVSIPLNAGTDPNLTNITDVLIHIYGPFYAPDSTAPLSCGRGQYQIRRRGAGGDQLRRELERCPSKN